MNRHLTIALFLATCAELPAAPPPELTTLQQQYEKVLAERVTAPFDTAKGDLDTKFIGALDRAADEAKKTGKLDDVLAIQDDKKRLSEKLPLPEDDDKTPEPLKQLRAIYRGQLGKLIDQRGTSHNAILPAFTAKLQALETTLTKADRINDAKAVREYSAALGPDASQAPVSAAGTNTEKPEARPGTTAAADTGKLPKGDPRKAAEWVLGLGGNISVREKGKDVKVTKIDELPKGRLTLVRVQLNSHFEGYRPITDQDMLILARQADLESVALFELPITDEGLKFMPTCPNMKFLETDGIQVTGEILAGWGSLKQLQRLNIANSRDFRGGNFEYLKNLPLADLNVKGADVNDDDLLVIAKLKKLRTLNLIRTKITDAGLAAFKKARPEVQIIRQ